MSDGLSYHQLHLHLWECMIAIQDLSTTQPALETVVIRGEHADFQLAAVHRQGKMLILDLGQKIND